MRGRSRATIPITAAEGEVWRVGTGARSLSWDLQLVDGTTHQPMTVQLTSNHLVVDGPTDAAGLAQPSGIFKTQVSGASAMPAPVTAAVSCSPLPAGHRRRIFFGFSDVRTADTLAATRTRSTTSRTVCASKLEPAQAVPRRLF